MAHDSLDHFVFYLLVLKADVELSFIITWPNITYIVYSTAVTGTELSQFELIKDTP